MPNPFGHGSWIFYITQKVALLRESWFSSLAQGWGTFQNQADAVEFVEWLMLWCDSPAFRLQWERRVHTAELGYHAEDQNETNAPIVFHQPGLQNSPMFITLQSLCDIWTKVDGMCTALSRVPTLLCIHFSRTYQDADQTIHKSRRALVCDEDLMIPVFTGLDTQVTQQAFTVLAATAHLGMPGAGHYRSALRVRDIHGRNCWAITEDEQSAILREDWPDWFISNVTLLWLSPAPVPQLDMDVPLEYTETNGDRLLQLLSH